MLYLKLIFCVEFDGFNDGVLPGVFLLSRWLSSCFPVDIAVLFGPGLIACVVIGCLSRVLIELQSHETLERWGISLGQLIVLFHYK